MDDFSSALYLGFRHAARSILPWQRLTTGVPATLLEPALNQRLANAVAAMQGLERGVVAPSSLHLFWDLMGNLGNDTLVLADAKVYEISKGVLERAACRGATVAYFKHHDPDSLQGQLQRLKGFGHKNLLVLTDGWCPHCGKPAPLPAYLALSTKHRGLLLLDDTQAFGILGRGPNKSMPYGGGGGGLLQWFGLQGSGIATVCSLSKGFGVPVSVLSGGSAFINRYVRQSEMRTHSSPVSAAHVHAALHALSENKEKGDTLRHKLLQQVRLFRKALAQVGFATRGSFFPVQTIAHTRQIPPHMLHRFLANLGIQALLLEPHQSTKPGVSFCLSASHTAAQVKRVAQRLSLTRQHVH